MDKKDVREIKRHTKRERSNITALYGCFVNDNKQVISQFKLPVGTMTETEADQFFQNIVKIFNGELGRNKLELDFNANQVMNDEQHKLLMKLRETVLEDEDALNSFYKEVIESLDLGGNYLILIGCDTYDVPFKGRSVDSDPDDDASGGEVFQYLVCSICPVKESQQAIEYKAKEKEFRSSQIAQLMKVPELGFMFPCFDNRSTNIYKVMLYTRKVKAELAAFSKAVFNIEEVAPPTEQKAAFAHILESALGDECTLDAIQAVQDRVEDTILLHRETRSKDPATFDKQDIVTALNNYGASEEAVQKFSEGYDEAFGAETRLTSKNILEKRRYQVDIGNNTSIKCSPEESERIHFKKMPDGSTKIEYIVPPGEIVEINGFVVRPDDYRDPDNEE